MKFDDKCESVISFRIELRDYVEQSQDVVEETIGWNSREKAPLEWCIGVHVASVVEKLLGVGSDRTKRALRAIVTCLEETNHVRLARDLHCESRVQKQ